MNFNGAVLLFFPHPEVSLNLKKKINYSFTFPATWFSPIGTSSLKLPLFLLGLFLPVGRISSFNLQQLGW